MMGTETSDGGNAQVPARMTPRQRLLATMRGEVADRVPLELEGFGCVSAEDIEEAPRREVASRIVGETHFFHSVPSFVNRYLVTPTERFREVSREEAKDGVRVTTDIDTPKGKLTAVTGMNPTSRTTWTIKYPVETRRDAEMLRTVPWERPQGLAPPDMTKVPAWVADRGIVRTGVSSPFVCVAGMMPYELFLEWCATDMELVRELSAQCLDRILDVLDVLFSRPGIEYVWMGGSEWVTPPMASPEVYTALVQAFEEPIIRRAHEAGALAHVHCHGNVSSTLEQVIERGADFLEPTEPPPDGDITFAEAKQRAAGRITLGGNLESRILEHGAVDEVEEATRAAFEGGKRRMVLQSTAGPISGMTERMTENYHRVIDVWESLSAIDG